MASDDASIFYWSLAIVPLAAIVFPVLCFPRTRVRRVYGIAVFGLGLIFGGATVFASCWTYIHNPKQFTPGPLLFGILMSGVFLYVGRKWMRGQEAG
jgi:hypothetical protein